MKTYEHKSAGNRVQSASDGISGKNSKGKHGLHLLDNRTSPFQAKEIKNLDGRLPVQCKSIVKSISTAEYKDNKANLGKVGKKMTAHLDPGNPIKGTKPSGTALQGVMAGLSNFGYKSMIKGHLMNGQLGGPGVKENLYPITSSANSKHKYYAENIIKEAMKNNDEITYTVTVEDALDSVQHPKATFHCEAYKYDPITETEDKASPVLKPTDIVSDPFKGTTGLGSVAASTAGYAHALGHWAYYKPWNPLSKVFATKKLPSGWGEKGSGKGTNHDWSHAKGMNDSLK